jgi:2-dehydro-3-deoxyphosphogluconate aldolase / (4S)-4-hydroxy-2-oxoglutarate aldolase
MRHDIVKRIEDSGVIAVIRMSNTEKLQQVITAISNGGVKALEITMTTPDAIEVIKKISKQISSDFMLGVGPVLDPETARAAILAGAEFVVGPTLNLDVIKMAHRYDKAVFPGAFTPTEILTAWENGADVVKVFPATALGPNFFKDVRGPLPQVKMTPTGGVSLDNAAEFIKCGAACLGVGTAMLDKKLIDASDWDGLSKLAAAFVAEVKKGRQK